MSSTITTQVGSPIVSQDGRTVIARWATAKNLKWFGGSLVFHLPQRRGPLSLDADAPFVGTEPATATTITLRLACDYDAAQVWRIVEQFDDDTAVAEAMRRVSDFTTATPEEIARFEVLENLVLEVRKIFGPAGTDIPLYYLERELQTARDAMAQV